MTPVIASLACVSKAFASSAVIFPSSSSFFVFAFTSTSSGESAPAENGAPVITLRASPITWPNENSGGLMPSAAAIFDCSTTWSIAGPNAFRRAT